MVYKYLGWGITNENGVAKLDHDAQGQEISHSYTGTGAGEIDVLASLDNPVSSGSIVSGTYNILDATFYDQAIDGHKNTKWVNQNGYSTIQVLSEGTKITEGSSANNITPSSVANSTSWNDRLTFTSDFVVEFDIVSYENDMYLKIIHDNTSHQKVFNATGHYKIVCSMTNGASYSVDGGTSISIYSGSMANALFAFATITTDTGTANIVFKDFVIYPI